MADTQFIGVYATNEIPSVMGAGGSGARPMLKRKRLWFVWSLGTDQYQIQALNAVFQPMAAPRIISDREFENRFSYEPACTAVPKEGDSLSDDAKAQTARLAPQKLRIRADDPDLLRSWLLQDASPERLAESSPNRKGPLAKLEEGSPQAPPVEKNAAPTASNRGDAGDLLHSVDAEQALRADFAMALLKMKQGKRREGIAMLDDILGWQGAPFEGAAELFSEFGLNLRRLGLTELAAKSHVRALALAPEDERVHFNLARVYHDMHNLEKAREHLGKALEIAPDFTTARQFLSFLTTPPPCAPGRGDEPA